MSFISETDLILNPDGSVYHLKLRPEHISDTIITVGDPSRVFTVSEHFDDILFEMNSREFITHRGTYKGKEVTVMSTGMGTDNVEIFLTELDALANIDLDRRLVKEKKRKLNIIRVGTSGSLQRDIPIGSQLVSETAVGLDTLMCFYDLPQSEQELEISNTLQETIGLPFKPYHVSGSKLLKKKFADGMIVGNTITSPGFYAPQGRRIRTDLSLPNLMNDLSEFNHQGFRLSNFEMETAGYYALCRLFGHEVISLNAILANRVTREFSDNPAAVIDDLIEKVLDRV